MIAIVQAVARGFVPDVAVARLPDELLSALPVLEAELMRELEQEGLDDEGPLDSEWRKSMGYRRLIGATALLKLAKVYDAKLQITTFLRLALIMQVRQPATTEFVGQSSRKVCRPPLACWRRRSCLVSCRTT